MSPIHKTSLVEFSAVQKHTKLLNEASVNSLLSKKSIEKKELKHPLHTLALVLTFGLLKK